ncbi:unnamed protein product [Urochloa decumbens]|uniref:ABC transporter B family member 19 n=1 Tax=Urochloa decumbens TaxID=240449 RepID=A0ABC9BCR1_9POAL
MNYYEDHSISSSHADDTDERRSTISVSPEASADEEPFSFFGLLCYADTVDWLLMALGTIGSVIHGIAFPVGYLLLGKALNAFGTNINDQEGMVHALYKVVPYVWYMAAATLPAGMVEISCWIYSSERQSARMRLAFLRSVLKQEVGAFDTDLTTATIIAGVTNHMSVIQDAIGEKLGHFVASFSTFFAGIIIAFISCWQVAMLSFLVIPLILVIGATYTKKINAISLSRNTIVSEAISVVEQTLSHIKTVFSFVGESWAMKSFVQCMENQFNLSKKEAMIKGIGLGLFQAVTFCSWALMVWIGAVAVTKNKATGGGTIAAIMSILFGAISITYAAPDLQTFNQAKAAGKEVFKVIKREPSISYDKGGAVLEKIHGEIKFRRVHFAYPSRQDKPILQGFSLTIPAGKVIALVGSSGCGKSTVISLLQRFYDPTSAGGPVSSDSSLGGRGLVPPPRNDDQHQAPALDARGLVPLPAYGGSAPDGSGPVPPSGPSDAPTPGGCGFVPLSGPIDDTRTAAASSSGATTVAPSSPAWPRAAADVLPAPRVPPGFPDRPCHGRSPAAVPDHGARACPSEPSAAPVAPDPAAPPSSSTTSPADAPPPVAAIPSHVTDPPADRYKGWHFARRLHAPLPVKTYGASAAGLQPPAPPPRPMRGVSPPPTLRRLTRLQSGTIPPVNYRNLSADHDNLRIGKMDASDEEIIKAATTANVQSFISKLPNEYLTEVGERGVQLSGGQKQRIAIARAILKDPPILLLDEATSALDSESEKLVQDALERAMRGRTVILIAHRMSTIVNADTIVVVENGRVAQTGTHHELLEKSTFYSNVCSMQNIEKEAEKKVASTSDNVIEEEIGEAHIRQFSTNQGTKNKLERVELKQPNKETVREIHPFFRLWYGLHKEDILSILFGSSAAAISGISKPLFGYFIMTIGVAYYDPDAKRKVSKYSLIFFGAGMVTLVSNILQHYIYGIVGEKAMKNLREALFSAVLRNELGWFEKPKNGVGFLTSRIVSDTSTVKTIISDRMAVIVQCISSILIATIVSMYVNWRMGLVSWAVMPCHFIGGLIQAKSAKGFYGDSAIAHRELVSLASEAASNIRTVASFVYEDEIIKKAELSLQEPLKKTKIESMKYGVIQGISLCLWNIAHAVALWYTTVLVQRKQASFENSIRSYQIFSLTVPSITELWTLIPMVMSAIAVLNPAFDTLDRETQIVPDKPENPSKGWLIGRTEFQDVQFNYLSRPEVTILDGFNLLIEPGQRVALVGPSGAGKSSVLALILRFYDPYGGRVLIDNKNIRDYNLRWLRKQIGLVQQEPILFNISIRDNISYGSEGTSETEIIEAAMKANIHEFISGLPEGYDTVVGEKGSQLSGGQKQRIAIARTLLKRPVLLLLDEATSALDGESERVVMSSLGAKEWTNKDDRASKITSITVAHRLSTVINADTIVVMEKGKVVELGNHQTLISADDGVYSRLFHLQSNMKD